MRNDEKSSHGHPHSGEFGRLLAASGLKAADLAKQIDTHPNTISRWRRNGAPGAALAYLRLYIDVKQLLDRI